MIEKQDPHAHNLVNISQINPTFKLDIKYATPHNVSGKILYSKPNCYLLKKTADKLNAVQKELAYHGLSLKVFDGYRPLSVQRTMWQVFPDERYIAHPDKGSCHNRGAAVDVTLVELATGKELLMPSAYDDFSERAHRDYPMTNPEALDNTKLLESIMKKHGFVGLPTEWWHFDDADAQHHPLLDIPFDQID